MSAQTRTIQEVAHDALEDLGSAQIVLRKVEAMLCAALADKRTGQHVRNLVDAAWNLAADGASAADCNYEAISATLAGCVALGAEPMQTPPLPNYLLDQRSNEVAEAISAERAHATRWWTHLNEMRRRKELPEWVGVGIGTHDEHDQMLGSRKAVNRAIFGSDDLGGDQPYRAIPLGQA